MVKKAIFFEKSSLRRSYRNNKASRKEALEIISPMRVEFISLDNGSEEKNFARKEMIIG